MFLGWLSDFALVLGGWQRSHRVALSPMSATPEGVSGWQDRGASVSPGLFGRPAGSPYRGGSPYSGSKVVATEEQLKPLMVRTGFRV